MCASLQVLPSGPPPLSYAILRGRPLSRSLAREAACFAGVRASPPACPNAGRGPGLGAEQTFEQGRQVEFGVELGEVEAEAGWIDRDLGQGLGRGCLQAVGVAGRKAISAPVLSSTTIRSRAWAYRTATTRGVVRSILRPLALAAANSLSVIAIRIHK